jgi:hypothetical protein
MCAAANYKSIATKMIARPDKNKTGGSHSQPASERLLFRDKEREKRDTAL